MLLWVSVNLKVIQFGVEDVVLGVWVRELVHKRSQWGLGVQMGKTDDGLEVLCCSLLEKLGGVTAGWILVM
jgi:hypothetical protein